MVGQGNQWSDYCDKGSDSNGDGFADNVSSSGNDWPYNETVSTKLSSDDGISIVDYAPKIISCPAAEQFLSSGGGGGSSTAAAAAPASKAAAAAAASAGSKTTPTKDIYTAQEAKKFLKAYAADISTNEKITKVKVTLENTGNKRMSLFPGLDQEAHDFFFIVTKKTLGYEGSFFDRIAGISYSKDKIGERLLKAQILNPEQIVLEPGQKLEKTLEVKEGLVAPRQIKIQFTTVGEVVKEQTVNIKPKKYLSGTAVDIDEKSNKLDMYALLIPEQILEEIEKQYSSSITGAAVSNLKRNSNDYFIELNFNKKLNSKIPRNLPLKLLPIRLIEMIQTEKTHFSDYYGPYHLKENKTFIFAQQFKYNPQKYSGDYIIRSKIYKGDQPIVKNEFEVTLGKDKNKKTTSSTIKQETKKTKSLAGKATSLPKTTPTKTEIKDTFTIKSVKTTKKEGPSFFQSISTYTKKLTTTTITKIKSGVQVYGMWIIPLIAAIVVIGMILTLLLFRWVEKEVVIVEHKIIDKIKHRKKANQLK